MLHNMFGRQRTSKAKHKITGLVIIKYRLFFSPTSIQVRNLRAMQEGYSATMSFFVYNYEKKRQPIVS